MEPIAAPRLRIAVVLDRLEQPAWVGRLLAAVAAAPFAELQAIVLDEGAAVPPLPRPLFRRLYDAADHLLTVTEPDLFAPLDVASAVPGPPVLRVGASGRSTGDAGPLAALCPLALDVVLDFGTVPASPDVRQAARYGVWRLTPPGEGEEVLAGAPATRAAIEVGREGVEGTAVVFAAFARTHRLSERLNRTLQARALTSGLLARLRAVHALGPAALTADGEGGAAVAALPVGGAGGGGLRQLGRLLERNAREGLHRAVMLDQWALAYRLGGRPWTTEELRSFTPLVPPKDRFWADPFPWVHEGRRYILFEEHPYDGLRGGHGKGHISAVEVDERGVRMGPTPVLVRDYHLSYPFVFAWRGAVYLFPETALADRLELYRCREFPFEWELDRVFMEGIRLADPTLVEVDGRWWMFASAEAGRLSELHLFHAPAPVGPWTPHPMNPVKVDMHAGRPAGGLFWHGGALYRPAQDGTLRYGHAVVINRVTRLDPTGFAETPVGRLCPTFAPRVRAIHTVNASGDLAVVDAQFQRLRYP